jgi:8-oxo-dGTP diphosphatase
LSDFSGTNRIIEVAAAIILHANGVFLLAQRPEGKPYAGYWEFPGGKVEPGESPRQALARELREELGIEVETAYPWITRVYAYPHATVRLHFFRVTAWHGEPHPHEGQQLAWQHAGNDISVEPLLPANFPVLRALGLPELYAISNAKELGIEEFLRRLELTLRNGLRLLQLREKHLSRNGLLELAQRTAVMAHAYGAKVLLNGNPDMAREAGADGIHLDGSQLASLTERPDAAWCAASCHNAVELGRAQELGCDFAVLSPVLPTQSHPGAPVLGWENFSGIISGASIPVYALGGLSASDLETAWRHGAHGVALLRQAWSDASVESSSGGSSPAIR